MNKTVYNVFGWIFTILSILYFIALVLVSRNESFWNDGFWFLFLSAIILFASGITYLLFAKGKITISKLSNRSLKLMILALGIAVGGFILTLILVFASGDGMGMILVGLFFLLAGFVVVVAFIMLIFSLKTKYQKL